MSHLIDITGKRFGKLIVLKKMPSLPTNTNTRWLCKCDCGNLTEIAGCHLKGGKIVSCGCVRDFDFYSKLSTKHGFSGTPLHDIWCAMKDRCYLKSNGGYHNYGGRGIRVCKKWKNNFLSFRKWALENGWESGLTIERIRVNGNYEPTNCKWATMAEQSLNKRDTTYIIFNGEKQPLLSVYRNISSPVSIDMVRRRLNQDWDTKEALIVPPKTGKNAKKYKYENI